MWCEVRVKLVVGTQYPIAVPSLRDCPFFQWIISVPLESPPGLSSLSSICVAVLVPMSQSGSSLWKPGGVSPPTMFFLLFFFLQFFWLL